MDNTQRRGTEAANTLILLASGRLAESRRIIIISLSVIVKWEQKYPGCVPFMPMVLLLYKWLWERTQSLRVVLIFILEVSAAIGWRRARCS